MSGGRGHVPHVDCSCLAVIPEESKGGINTVLCILCTHFMCGCSYFLQGTHLHPYFFGNFF